MELPTRIAARPFDETKLRQQRGTEQGCVIDQAPSGSVARWFTSRRLVVFVLLASIFTMTAGAITDPDFWWHLRTGQLICETRAVPHADVFSLTAQGKAWVTHEWLAEVVMYAVYRAAGWGGLVAFFSLVTTVALWLVERRAERRGAHRFVACGATLFAALATMPIWGVRPQMISFLFASFFIFTLDDYAQRDSPQVERRRLDQTSSGLDRSRRRTRRNLWLLVPLMLVWVNVHAGFALGLALVAFACVGGALDELLINNSLMVGNSMSNDGSSTVEDASLVDDLSSDKEAKSMRVRRAWRRARPLCLVCIACVAVVPLNPSGVRLFAYPFETLNSRTMQYIIEWLSPDFHQPNAQAFALLLLATFAALALSPKRARPSELLLVAVAAYASLRAWRNIPLFALVAAPLLAEHAWGIIKRERASRREKKEGASGAEKFVEPSRASGTPSRASLVLNFVALVCVPLGLCAMRVAATARAQTMIEAEEFPSAAVEFLRSHQTPGALFNAYGFGGYLVWKLYPARLVFIDGRADVYGDALVEEYLRAEGGEPGWRATLDKFHVGAVMIKPDAALASLLAEDTKWEKVYEDKQAVIFFKH
jgi:hypothetical protein